MQLVCRSFDALDTGAFHDLIQLRINVFVVEQQCPYPELDGRDKQALHILGLQGAELIAAARLLPPGEVYAEPALGRFVVHPAHRGRGLAHQLVCYCIEQASHHFPGPLRISAQAYLQPFYEQHGFVWTGEAYDEDGIPHIGMRRAAGI